MSTTKIYEYAIFDHLLDDATVRALSEEAFRGHQYEAGIITLERKHAVLYRDLVRPLVIKEAKEDVFAKIDQLLDAYKAEKKTLAESQKKAGKEKVTRAKRVDTKENTALMALKAELKGTKARRDAATATVLQKFFYKYDREVSNFVMREKLKARCGTNFKDVAAVCPTLAIKHASNHPVLIDALVQDRNALFEQRTELRKAASKAKRKKATFAEQSLLDDVEKRLAAYQVLLKFDNHAERKFKLPAIKALRVKYPNAVHWQQLMNVREQLDDFEHKIGKDQIPCTTATFAQISDARKRARQDSLGGSTSWSLPFCKWDKPLPKSAPFDGTVICGWQGEAYTPKALLTGQIDKFKALPTSTATLDAKHFRARKVAQAGVSTGWSPQVYSVDMHFRGKSVKKGILENERIHFEMLVHRELLPNADIRWIYIKVWRKGGSLRYTVQFVVNIPDRPVSRCIADRQDAVAVVPRWNSLGVHDLVVANTFPATRNGEDHVVVCDKVRQHDGSYTTLSKHKNNIYRKKQEYVAVLQKVSDNYFDVVKERLHGIYLKDTSTREIFDTVIADLSVAHPSYSKVQLAYANRWRDHRKFRGFADALLEHYFDVAVINKEVWGMWRAHRFCGYKTAFDARAAKRVPNDLFHDDPASVKQNSASRDGWNDISVWVDVNYARLSALAKQRISKKLLTYAVYFYFWAKKDAHLDIVIERTRSKAIAWRNDYYSKRAHELAADYQHCILVKQDLRKVAQSPDFEDDDRSEVAVATNKLRQMVAPSEFINALKTAFGASRIVWVAENTYKEALIQRAENGLVGLSDAQLLHGIGIQILSSGGARSSRGGRLIASAKVVAK